MFNNVLGLAPGTTGASILQSGKQQLLDLYPHVEQIDREKVLEVSKIENYFEVKTNKNSYQSKIVVIAVGYTNLMRIKGLEHYIEPHPRAAIEKDRIWLKNSDHLITEHLYVAGTLAGWRSSLPLPQVVVHRLLLIF
ncbi:putative protein [Jejuia pallidilutea]|uniref:Uncharacterized protein n=1 Tax=Jejuia pallidilutea TaxID=504487 RepID=A0A090W0M5_9FLAO|nr:putative protein [Jejuia pallidilutea]